MKCLSYPHLPLSIKIINQSTNQLKASFDFVIRMVAPKPHGSLGINSISIPFSIFSCFYVDPRYPCFPRIFEYLYNFNNPKVPMFFPKDPRRYPFYLNPSFPIFYFFSVSRGGAPVIAPPPVDSYQPSQPSYGGGFNSHASPQSYATVRDLKPPFFKTLKKGLVVLKFLSIPPY